MLSLNLVSQELKQEIKLRRVYALIKKINLVLIFTTAIVASVLLMAKFVLQNSFNDIVEQTTLVMKNSHAYNNKIRQINSQLNTVAQIQGDFISWSKLLEKLANETPADIVFSFVKIDKESQTIKIKGKAATRDGLLVLRQNLENSAIFTNLDFPIKNILKQKNIDFEISAKLDIEKI